MACVGWARLSGAARFSATQPVTGGRPNVTTTRDALPVTLRQGVSYVVAGPPPGITRGSPGFVLVRGGLDRLAAGRPGPDPLPRLDSRPVEG
jgi:hypothetical protein